MSAGLLNSAECIGRAVERAVAATGAIQVDLCVHRFSPNGVTAVATLAESHLAVHPWPAHGCLAASQLGLFVARWVAVTPGFAWRRCLAGVGLLGVVQLATALGLAEFHHHIGLDLHTSVIRAWALSVSVLLVWGLERPVLGSSVLRTDRSYPHPNAAV